MDSSEPGGDALLTSAEFDRDAIVRYHWTNLIPISLFIVTIPLTMIFALVYWIVLDRIVASWSADLTPQSLIVRKGVWNKVERTIPLEKITDLSVAQGPIMRFCGIDRVGVETAGQTGNAGGGPLISLLGVKNSKSFRSTVLAQRDSVAGAATTKPSAPVTETGQLADIAATLKRIETILSTDREA